MRCVERLALLALGLLALSCVQAGKRTPDSTDPRLFTVQVFYTNDEHGWIEGQEPGHGAAALQERARALASASDAELWLSGGDNWTGPAISTWFEGRSVVEVMNAMGYVASAVGNHEFDFGLEALRERTGEARYPYLAANLRRRSTGEVPEDLGIRSHLVVGLGRDDRRLPVGIIGLITTDTPFVTNPATVAEFEFLPYEPSLRAAAAAAREEGARALIVLAHVCVAELRELALAVEDLGIAFFGGGHCNESHAEELDGAVLLSTAGGFSELGEARLSLDPRTGRAGVLRTSLRPNEGRRPGAGASPAAEVRDIVESWRARTKEQLGTVIGRLEHELPRRSRELEQLIVTAWLEALPTADIALMNRGGVRAGLPAGEVTLADVVAVLPFQNSIVLSEVPGEVLERAIAAHRPIVGGDADELEPDRRYRVLSNSFCYAGGDGWTFLAESDPEGYDTSVHFRQPVIDWLRMHR